MWIGFIKTLRAAISSTHHKKGRNNVVVLASNCATGRKLPRFLCEILWTPLELGKIDAYLSASSLKYAFPGARDKQTQYIVLRLN